MLESLEGCEESIQIIALPLWFASVACLVRGSLFWSVSFQRSLVPLVAEMAFCQLHTRLVSLAYQATSHLRQRLDGIRKHPAVTVARHIVYIILCLFFRSFTAAGQNAVYILAWSAQAQLSCLPLSGRLPSACQPYLRKCLSNPCRFSIRRASDGRFTAHPITTYRIPAEAKLATTEHSCRPFRFT